MNIEIHQPELEAMIQKHMNTGRFRDVEDVLVQALKYLPEAIKHEHQSEPGSLDELFAKVRGLFPDEELDFSRDPSPGRSVDLS